MEKFRHGHLEQVGYDTYCELLEEVIKEVKGTQIVEDWDVQIDIDVTSYIPDEYISDSSQKIDIYQKIALCKTEEDIQNVIDEIIDRYGTMPEQLENLIDIARIKSLCRNNWVEKIVNKSNFIVFTFSQKEFSLDVTKLVEKYKNNIRFSPGIKPRVTLMLKQDNEKVLLKEIKKFLNLVEEFSKRKEEYYASNFK